MRQRIVPLVLLAALSVSLVAAIGVSAPWSPVEEATPVTIRIPYPAGYPSEEELARSFGHDPLMPCYMDPDRLDLAPELGPPPPRRIVVTRQVMLAKWDLDSLYRQLGSGTLLNQIQAAEKKLDLLWHVQSREVRRREPTPGDPRFEEYSAIQEAHRSASQEHQKLYETKNLLVEQHGLQRLRTEAFVERRPEARAEWEQTVEEIPELAATIRGLDDLIARERTLLARKFDILTEGGSRPLLSPAQRAEQVRLAREVEQLKESREAIFRSPRLVAARQALWRIAHEEYQRQESEYQEFAHQLKVAGGTGGDHRRAYELQLWARERPRPE